MDNLIVFTTQAMSDVYGVNELHKTGLKVTELTWLDQGVGMVRIQEGFTALAETFSVNPPIFIRHICPAMLCVLQSLVVQDVEDIAQAASSAFGTLLDPTQTFSVQTVFLTDTVRPYRRFDVNARVSDLLDAGREMLEVKNPTQIVSIVQLPDRAYLGLSCARENLSNWAGGARRYAKEEGRISRAEFKLMEAIEKFEITLPEGGVALDFGAAPGGWTRVLRSHGLHVIAVDPAQLDPEVANDPGVTHFKGLAQTFMEKPTKCDVIVNDMRLDAVLSAQIMGHVAGALKTGGIAIMTLKLPQKNMQKNTARAMDTLRKWYTIVGARQLFHNRSEVTVILRPR